MGENPSAAAENVDLITCNIFLISQVSSFIFFSLSLFLVSLSFSLASGGMLAGIREGQGRAYRYFTHYPLYSL